MFLLDRLFMHFNVWNVLIGYMGRLFSQLRGSTAVKTDRRIRIMNEIISGMRVIKMYTWEKPFAALVNSTRE